MKKAAGPSQLFKQLNSIQNQYLGLKRRIEKEELVAVVFEVAPNKYYMVLAVESRIIGSALTLDDLGAAKTEQFRQTSCRRSKMK
jgi:hypothetical protein